VTSLPFSGLALLVRTDFRDDAAWHQLCDEIAEPSQEGFTADVEPVSDPSFGNTNWEHVKAAVPRNHEGSMIVLIADATTFDRPDHPILVIDLMDFQGEHLEPFRCIPAELWSVENNLNLANMDWDDFADSADEHSIFRGF
jgi:hypothetical protein